MTMCIDDPTCHENLRENPLIYFDNSVALTTPKLHLLNPMQIFILHESIEIGIAIFVEVFLLVLPFYHPLPLHLSDDDFVGHANFPKNQLVCG